MLGGREWFLVSVYYPITDYWLLFTGTSGRIPSSNGNDFIESGFAGDDFDPAIVCLLYTSDAADERFRVDLGGRRIIKKT